MEIRLNIFDENNKWVGQEYLTEKGKWLHRWTKKGELEKGSWRGRAKGDNELNWRYERVEEEDSSVLQANELLPYDTLLETGYLPPDSDDVCWEKGKREFTRKEVAYLLYTQRAMISNDLKAFCGQDMTQEMFDILNEPRQPEW